MCLWRDKVSPKLQWYKSGVILVLNKLILRQLVEVRAMIDHL